jgi:bifunctional DNA-binding transcriptional regulator/antitoxin component of YhaV-PrlF toxin-antitoxin module
MKDVLAISKVTERGQITLPKRIRDSHYFSGARVVSISEKLGVITITPIKSVQDEQLEMLDASMRDWADSVNDGLFDFTV